MIELLDKVMQHNMIQYKGCLIMFNRGKYLWNRKAYDTIQLAKDAVDSSIKALQNSLG